MCEGLIGKLVVNELSKANPTAHTSKNLAPRTRGFFCLLVGTDGIGICTSRFLSPRNRTHTYTPIPSS